MMIKRIVCLMMMFLIASSALAVTPAKKKSPEKPAKKAVKVKQKATKQKSTVIEDEKTDETQQLREDTNKAVAELKSQIDSVKADNSDAKVGGVIFFRWAKPASNTQFNNFDIDRAYVDIRKKLAGGSAMRVTLDVARLTTAMDTAKANQHLFDYLKYAYVDVPISLPKQSQIIPFNATAKLGLQHTVWIDWMDKIMDIRFIAKSLVDNKGLMSSERRENLPYRCCLR
jgi:hypothetical protein